MAFNKLTISFGTCLLFIMVFETSLGGGGRLFDTGIISPRMVLFGAGVGYSVVMFLRSVKIPIEFGVLTVIF
jgi:hypothetical protein